MHAYITICFSQFCQFKLKMEKFEKQNKNVRRRYELETGYAPENAIMATQVLKCTSEFDASLDLMDFGIKF